MYMAISSGILKAERPADLERWVRNHFRWIVWKAASLERSFPEKLGGKRLTVAAVYTEICRRYLREIVRGESSALKQICEHSEPAGRYIVLCVAAVGTDDKTRTLEVTDGWCVIIP
jgi:breast cancer 2 susceptibility protein